MNTELLKKIRERIVNEPELFDMYDFVKDAECGTAHCIGGYAIFLSGLDMSLQNYHARAQDVLDLTDSQAYALFYVDSWPHDLYRAYEQAMENDDLLRAASIAVDRIDLFLLTGGAE